MDTAVRIAHLIEVTSCKISPLHLQSTKDQKMDQQLDPAQLLPQFTSGGLVRYWTWLVQPDN